MMMMMMGMNRKQMYADSGGYDENENSGQVQRWWWWWWWCLSSNCQLFLLFLLLSDDFGDTPDRLYLCIRVWVDAAAAAAVAVDDVVLSAQSANSGALKLMRINQPLSLWQLSLNAPRAQSYSFPLCRLSLAFLWHHSASTQAAVVQVWESVELSWVELWWWCWLHRQSTIRGGNRRRRRRKGEGEGSCLSQQMIINKQDCVTVRQHLSQPAAVVVFFLLKRHLSRLQLSFFFFCLLFTLFWSPKFFW